MFEKSSHFYRRNLPHWHPPGSNIFVTWRLEGSLPKAVLARVAAERKLIERESALPENRRPAHTVLRYKKLFAEYDNELDRMAFGPRHLSEDRIADIVEQALLVRSAALYHLWAYVVMPNHVHEILQRTGQSFWQDESFDHWSRDAEEFVRIARYVENNPVKAGLVARPEDWRWSSAYLRLQRGLSEFVPLT